MDKATKEFRVNALCAMAMQGLTLKDLGRDVKRACLARKLVKNADGSIIGGIGDTVKGVAGGVKDLGSLALGGATTLGVLSLLASLGVGYLGGKVVGNVTAPTDEDVEMERMKDQIHAYSRAIERQRGERIAGQADQSGANKGVRISSAF